MDVRQKWMSDMPNWMSDIQKWMSSRVFYIIHPMRLVCCALPWLWQRLPYLHKDPLRLVGCHEAGILEAGMATSAQHIHQVLVHGPRQLRDTLDNVGHQ